MKKGKVKAFKLKPERYYNIGEVRADLWNELKAVSFKISENSDLYLADDLTYFRVIFEHLDILEGYWAFPGTETIVSLHEAFKNKEYKALYRNITEVARLIASHAYREINPNMLSVISSTKERKENKEKSDPNNSRYFEVLLVGQLKKGEEIELKKKLLNMRDSKDQFVYRALVAVTFQDALIALHFNHNIQAVVVRYGIPFESKHSRSWLEPFTSGVLRLGDSEKMEVELGRMLGATIKDLRPELDIYYMTDAAVGKIPDEVLRNFRRIFYRQEDPQELHLSIIGGIRERYETPFFTALKEYSKRPTSVFHAMPISRGNSIFKSEWIQDFGDFYGRNLFLAETSSTGGGLDSLLQPTGPLKRAQEIAGKVFGSQHTYFATNGTSTSNKIVLQALVEPDDVVLIDRDCHKSHHYGMVLSGSYAVYLDSYPLEKYSMYGAVSLSTIKSKLMELKKGARLDKVKMLLLTNCTFDGLVYNTERVMEEVLAIKSDMIFLWDEAWFGFAAFTHIYRRRTAMSAAKKLHERYSSEAYAAKYKEHISKLDKGELPSLPDPEKVKIRVYATQSTHKTLSSLRQGSMIHIYDEEFNRKVHDPFHEAYMTHTSTSPNYQILASLDAGRRQVSFEGYAMVEKSIELAMTLRAKVNDHPDLRKYFQIISVEDLIPEKYRSSMLTKYYDRDTGWSRLSQAWETDEFVLDPTKVNLHIGKTGVDGDTFKNQYLMELYNIQINKTSRNTVLFMTNIGTTHSSVSYLVSALLKISKQLDEKFEALNPVELKIEQDRIYSLNEDTPPLPHFSYFHDSFKAVPGVPGGDLRSAYFLSYNENKCEYVRLEDCENFVQNGRQIVSASFVIPYPPGFPILVPGQVMTMEILQFLVKLDVKEIHGYRPELGLKVFTEGSLNRQKSASAMIGVSMGEAKKLVDKSK